MSKSVRPKDLADKISFGLTKVYISAAYFIVWTDKIFKIIPNDWHVQNLFDISELLFSLHVCIMIYLYRKKMRYLFQRYKIP